MDKELAPTPNPEEELQTVTEQVMSAAISLDIWGHNAVAAGYPPLSYERFESTPDDLVRIVIAGAHKYHELKSQIADSRP
jgi:hypothetical protein